MATRGDAVCLIKSTPHYRRGSFAAGLKHCGFNVVVDRPRRQPAAGDILVTWNRHGMNQRFAQQFEQAGCPVIVVENGYLGRDANGHQLYAMARSQHNGAGRWPRMSVFAPSNEGQEADFDRWAPLGIELKPWRTTGSHILLLPQRGIGPPGVAMPPEWPAQVLARLQTITKRPVRMRPHPGGKPLPLEPDLQGAWACVTWASSAGLKAIVAGVPVFHSMPDWIGAGAARFDLSGIEAPYTGDRLPTLQRLAWAQWRLDEIAAGEPFERLLEVQ